MWDLIVSVPDNYLSFYFTARSTLVPYAFVWEKGKTMDLFRNYSSL